MLDAHENPADAVSSGPRRVWPLGYRLAGHAFELLVAAAWLAADAAISIDLGLAEQGSRLADVPDVAAAVITAAPVVGIGSWLVRYVGTARSRRTRRIGATIGLALCALAWVVAVLVARSYDY